MLKPRRCASVTVRCDVAQQVDVQRMATTIRDAVGGVDIIVNSASLFEKMDFPTADTAVGTCHGISIDGPFYVCNSLVPDMLARRRRDRQYSRSVRLGAVA